MGYNFLPCDRNQSYLLPPSLADWLPQGHLAWFVLDAVERIDLGPFYAKYHINGVGNSAFNPSMMVALLIYAYCTGERSSRQIEKHCQADVAYKVITANQSPDHTTISRFRKDNQSHLKSLFLEILRLCGEAGLVKLGTVSLDGTKIKASASLAANRTLEHLEQEKAQAVAAQQDKIEQRVAKEESTGKKARGRTPKSPEETENKEATGNVTDPESRIMKTQKGYVQGLNAQAVVTEQQVIVAEDVTQQENDKKQLHPMLAQAESNRQAVAIKEKIVVALADCGYGSEENFTKTVAGDIELLVATQKDHKQRKAMKDQPPPDDPIPEGLSPIELMERKLLTERGRQLYKLRGQTVEPVFGQIKDVRGFDRFMQRGVEACRGEWSLICATHNL